MRRLVWNCIVSAGILTLGDLISQAIERKTKHKELDIRRLTSMCLFGGLFRGPVLYLWFSKGIGRLFPGKGLKVVIKKTAFDQILCGPPFMAVFFVTITLANGGDWQDAKRKLQREFIPAQLRAWVLWPSVQLINFWLVSPQNQLMVMNVVAVGWMGYLSYLEFRGKIHHQGKVHSQ